MGRPSKLTPERQQKLADAIRAGNYYETACTYAGIDYSTFRLWMTAGEKATRGKFFEFFETITRAESEAEARAVALWQKAMPEDWRAAQMFLERRHPDRWGKQDRLDLKQSGKVAVEHGVETDSANALLAALGFGPVGTTESGDADDGDPGSEPPTTDSHGSAGSD